MSDDQSSTDKAAAKAAKAAQKIDELANPTKLGVWMDAQGLPGEGEPDVTFVSGGAANEIFGVERGGKRMVLRRPPRVVPAGRNETMVREHRILSALNDTDVPHPTAIALCDDESVLPALAIATLTPMSLPVPSTSAPPELPGLIAASVWITAIEIVSVAPCCWFWPWPKSNWNGASWPF